MTKLVASTVRISREVQGGLVLFAAALAALIIANSPLGQLYHSLDDITEPSLLFLVNDGFMSLFFLVVGLEIRREIIDGELNSFAKAALPAIAALGGMLVPALLYLFIAQGNPEWFRGFGIPVATDIAFAVSLLALFGRRVPLSLKAFLIALAIFDDIGAILLIAVFYSHDLSLLYFGLAVSIGIAMVLLRRWGIQSLIPYLFLASLLWCFTLWSGIHPTISGVVLAFLLPLETDTQGSRRGANWLKHRLEPWITFGVLPLFAFLNAGVSFAGTSMNDIVMPVSLGIAAGLLIGKPVGIFLFTWLCVIFRLAPKPQKATWPQVLGVAVVCGIGFTMSLFVGMLAFEDSGEIYQAWVRTGVLLGSLSSAIVGSLILHFVLRKT